MSPNGLNSQAASENVRKTADTKDRARFFRTDENGPLTSIGSTSPSSNSYLAAKNIHQRSTEVQTADRTILSVPKYLSILLSAIAALALLVPTPVDATRCRDGSYLSSSGPGTCSWRGGIDDDTPIFGGGGSGSGSGNSGVYYDKAPNSVALTRLIAYAGLVSARNQTEIRLETVGFSIRNPDPAARKPTSTLDRRHGCTPQVLPRRGSVSN